MTIQKMCSITSAAFPTTVGLVDSVTDYNTLLCLSTEKTDIQLNTKCIILDNISSITTYWMRSQPQLPLKLRLQFTITSTRAHSESTRQRKKLPYF